MTKTVSGQVEGNLRFPLDISYHGRPPNSAEPSAQITVEDHQRSESAANPVGSAANKVGGPNAQKDKIILANTRKYGLLGKRLILRWKKWSPETLVQTAPGVFSSKVYKFTLTR